MHIYVREHDSVGPNSFPLVKDQSGESSIDESLGPKLEDLFSGYKNSSMMEWKKIELTP